MTPTNRLTGSAAAAMRARILGGGGSSKVAAVASGKKKPKSRPEDRVIQPAYESPEAGIEIIDVPCYLPSINVVMSKLRYGHSFIVDQWKKDARNAVLGCLARNLPEWCIDQNGQARLDKRSLTLRNGVTFVVLSRIAPTRSKLDDDNNVGALKGVRDTLCAWLVNGPIFDVERIGDFDDIVYSPSNPHGRVQFVCDQIMRKEAKYGVRIELHSK